MSSILVDQQSPNGGGGGVAGSWTTSTVQLYTGAQINFGDLTSVADPDPGSGIGFFLTPGSGIRDGRKS